MNTRKNINNLINEIENLYHELCVQIGISDSESMVLYTLNDAEGPITQADICKATGISKQTLNSTIQRLIEQDIIVLNSADKKSKTISLTEKGQLFLSEKVAPLVAVEERIYASWTDKEKEMYVRLTNKFKTQMEEEIHAYGKK